MAGKVGRSGRTVSTGRIAVGKVVLDVGAPEGTSVASIRLRRAAPPSELEAALRAGAPSTAATSEEPSALQAAEEAIDDAGKVTGEVDRAATLFTKLVRGEVDVGTIAAELERLVVLLVRLDRAGRYGEALQLARVLTRLLTLATSWVALVQTLRVAAHAARELADSDALAWVLHELGTLALGADDAQAATADLREARRLRAAQGDRAGLAVTNRNLRAARWPYASHTLGVAGALALGIVLALVIAGGIDPDPTPTTDGGTTVVPPPPPPPSSPPPPPPGDQTAPRPTLRLAGTTAGPTNDPTPAFAGSAGTAAGDRPAVTVRIHRGTNATGDPLQRRRSAVAADGSYAALATELSSGTYTARAEQRDEAGNTGHSEEVTFRLDLEPPRVAISAPANRDTTDESPGFRGTAGQDEGDAPVVTLMITPQPGAIEIPLEQDGTWSRSVAVQSVEDPGYGYRQFTATVTQTDEAGNTVTATVVFTPEPDGVD